MVAERDVRGRRRRRGVRRARGRRRRSGTGAERSYDLIVRGPAPAGSGGTEGWATSPASLPTYSGGITLAQYDTIRHLSGVAVAAPMTMVGYLPLTVQVPVEIPASAIGGAPRSVTLTVRLRSDN